MKNTKEITSFLSENSYKENEFSFIDLFPAAAFVLSNGLVIIKANKYAESILGDETSAIGKNIIEIVSENDSEELVIRLNESFADFIPGTFEIKVKLSENVFLDVLSMFHSFKDPDTGEKFCVFALLDFTPYKMKEEIIRDSETRFKNMANTAPVMIWISDVDGLFSFVNNVWLEFSGGELGSQLGMNWLNHVHTEDLHKLLNEYQNALKTRKSFSVEFRFMNRNETYEWMLLKGKPRFNSENVYSGFIGSCINIQEQKEIEAKISNLNEELIQTVATRDKFFSIISHDLRSPLGGLMGILDILNSSYDSLDEKEKKEIISNATQVSKTTYTLMENLLEWSRIQTGRIHYDPENLDIHRLVENVASVYEPNIKGKEINFSNSTKREHLIFADKLMTEAVLRNLISNAIKFTYQGGQIDISSEIKNETVIIQVKDSGVGIDESKIPDLFRVDVSISTKGTAKETGTGLGLVICKELVKKQLGRIWVESKKDRGSSFCFSVPIAK